MFIMCTYTSQVHIYLYTHIHVYAYAYLCVYTYICTFISIYIHIYIYSYLCTHIHIFIYMHIYLHLSIHTYIHMCPYLSIYTHMHILLLLFFSWLESWRFLLLPRNNDITMTLEAKSSAKGERLVTRWCEGRPLSSGHRLAAERSLRQPSAYLPFLQVSDLSNQQINRRMWRKMNLTRTYKA